MQRRLVELADDLGLPAARSHVEAGERICCFRIEFACHSDFVARCHDRSFDAECHQKQRARADGALRHTRGMS